MGSTEMEEQIDEIISYVQSCRTQHLNSMNAVVPKQELYDMLEQLKADIPVSVRKYDRIIKQREQIIEDAQQKADAILAEAKEKYKTLIEEHTIMQQAYQQAEITRKSATDDANRIIEDAMRQKDELTRNGLNYVAELFEKSDQLLSKAYESTLSNAKNLEDSMLKHLDDIRSCREQLEAAVTPQQPIKVEEPRNAEKQEMNPNGESNQEDE